MLCTTTACTFSTSQLPKVLRNPRTFDFETCFAPQNGVHFFDIAASKSAPKPFRNVLHATQQRALFRHRSFQKCSETVTHLTSQCASRATTACTCSTSQLPKVLRPWCVLCILTSKRASRHNGVHFFDISTSKQKSSEFEVLCTF